MKSIVVGTAGHVDHGKTTLVKALPESTLIGWRRKNVVASPLTWDLPIWTSSCQWREPEVGVVDVPGHERFVRNMLAGIGGIDLVLLVIAADESIKPQTREHFDILRYWA